MRTKNRKSEYKPIKVVGKEKYIVAWDYQPIFKDGKETNLGTWEEFCFNHKPSETEIKSVILSYYNTKVEMDILNGYQWNGHNIWLSSENQFNYKAAYDLAVQTNGATLPLKFKFGETASPEYHTFTELNELQDFYMGAIAHIQKTLNEGWAVKDSIDWDLYKTY